MNIYFKVAFIKFALTEEMLHNIALLSDHAQTFTPQSSYTITTGYEAIECDVAFLKEIVKVGIEKHASIIRRIAEEKKVTN